MGICGYWVKSAVPVERVISVWAREANLMRQALRRLGSVTEEWSRERIDWNTRP